MVDVFDRHEVRFDPRLAGCSKFVRHSDYAALEAQLARHPEPVVDTEPWGYWVKHKYAEGGLVRTPCFAPEESHYTEVLPLFTRPSEQAVTEAGKGLLRIVEEIDGAMKHGTWRDEKGMRLKDTPEWVAFYNAIKAAIRSIGRKA